MRNTYRSWLAVLSCSLLMALSGTAQAQAKATKIRFGNTSGVAFPTVIIAEEKGFFKKENLEVETTYVVGSGSVAEGLASANLDLGNASPTTAVLAIAKGAKVKVLSGFEYTFTDKNGRQWESTYIAVRGGESIKGLKDLRGKRIAVNDLGSTYNYMLRDQFAQLGMDSRKDVSIIPMPFSQMAGALVQKQVDAIVAISDAIFQVRQRMPIEIIGSHTSLEGTDISLTSSVVVNNEFLRKDPDAVVRFLRALLQARQWMDQAVASNNPELQDIVARVMKFNPERAKVFFESRGGYYGADTAFVNTLDIPQRVIKRQVEILKSAELIPTAKAWRYDEFVDISYLRKAYESLGMRWDASKH